MAHNNTAFLHRTVWILSSLTLLSVACFIVIFCTSGHTHEQSPSTAFSIPDVPHEVTFAGEKITLHRYDLYERYERELTASCYMHSTTLLTLKRANRYLPVIEPIMKENGLPTDFIYLAAIESHFNPRAYSRAKAAGIWQFMPKTAREFGLEVNEYVDERYHVEKATVAACKYLKGAFRRYGSWVNAAASYNAGQGRISQELSRQNASSALDLYLIEETSRYVFRILAMKQVMAHPARYGFALRADQLYQPIATRSLEVDSAIVDLATWATEQGSSYMQLKEFNPWLIGRELPNKSKKKYKIQLPIEEDMYYHKDRHYKVHNENWVVK